MKGEIVNYTKTLPYELDLTSRVLHEVMVSFFKNNNFPISLEEFIILDCLSMNPEIIQIQIAKMTLKGRGHTGKFLKSLEEKKLITRIPVKKDFKVVIKIEITQNGKNLYKKMNSNIQQFVNTINPEIETKINTIIKDLQFIREDAIKKFNIKFE